MHFNIRGRLTNTMFYHSATWYGTLQPYIILGYYPSYSQTVCIEGPTDIRVLNVGRALNVVQYILMFLLLRFGGVC